MSETCQSNVALYLTSRQAHPWVLWQRTILNAVLSVVHLQTGWFKTYTTFSAANPRSDWHLTRRRGVTFLAPRRFCLCARKHGRPRCDADSADTEFGTQTKAQATHAAISCGGLMRVACLVYYFSRFFPHHSSCPLNHQSVESVVRISSAISFAIGVIRRCLAKPIHFVA